MGFSCTKYEKVLIFQLTWLYLYRRARKTFIIPYPSIAEDEETKPILSRGCTDMCKEVINQYIERAYSLILKHIVL